jgi:hypothetical protein
VNKKVEMHEDLCLAHPFHATFQHFHITSGKLLKNSLHTTQVQLEKRQMKIDEMDKEKL